MKLKETSKSICSEVMSELKTFTVEELREALIKEHPDFYWSQEKVTGFLTEFLQEKKIDVENDKFVLNTFKIYEKEGKVRT